MGNFEKLGFLKIRNSDKWGILKNWKIRKTGNFEKLGDLKNLNGKKWKFQEIIFFLIENFETFGILKIGNFEKFGIVKI